MGGVVAEETAIGHFGIPKPSGAMKREVTQPRWVLIAHMFNHQTHHRGQVHCLLTQAGGKPSATDLPFMPG